MSSEWGETVGSDIRADDVFFGSTDRHRAFSDAEVRDGIAHVRPYGGGEFSLPADMSITVLREA